MSGQERGTCFVGKKDKKPTKKAGATVEETVEAKTEEKVEAKVEKNTGILTVKTSTGKIFKVSRAYYNKYQKILTIA